MQGAGSQDQRLGMLVTMKIMNNALNECFDDCINDFRSQDLSSTE